MRNWDGECRVERANEHTARAVSLVPPSTPMYIFTGGGKIEIVIRWKCGIIMK